MALEEVAIIVGHAARAQMAAQRRHDERLDLGGGNAADQSGWRRLILQHSLGDLIAVAEAAILSRTRSPISSRSNWANDRRTLSSSMHCSNGAARKAHERQNIPLKGRTDFR
jgi:hypothetical protein